MKAQTRDRYNRDVEKSRDYHRQWRANNPVSSKNAHYKAIYGISEEDYQRMVEAQGGLCAICNRPERMKFKGALKRLAVDHCHMTGDVRGLLCHACNCAIGKLGDAPDLLRAAANYLEKSLAGCINPVDIT